MHTPLAADFVHGTPAGPRGPQGCEPFLDPVGLAFHVLDGGDRAAIVRLHERLSTQTTYLRYFSCRPPLTPAYLDRMTRSEPGACEYLGVFTPDRPDLVGLAGYHREAVEREASIAVLVEDAHQGRGLGTLLVRGLALLACRKGVGAFTAETLPENRRIRAVLRRAGFDPTTAWADGIVRVRFAIGP